MLLVEVWEPDRHSTTAVGLGLVSNRSVSLDDLALRLRAVASLRRGSPELEYTRADAQRHLSHLLPKRCSEWLEKGSGFQPVGGHRCPLAR